MISVRDNGPGIPDAIKDKIFQPFFTTKPTGQGTGLGLSLSYDIMKAHGGEIRVDSEVGEGNTDPLGKGKSLPADRQGTEFIITLPIS
jgi:signal transduction histidine kinase